MSTRMAAGEPRQAYEQLDQPGADHQPRRRVMHLRAEHQPGVPAPPCGEQVNDRAGGHTVNAVVASRSPSPSSGTPIGGCGGTQVQRGDPPGWAAGEKNGFHGPNTVPYVVSTHERVVAYLWGYPMTTHPTSHRDKILWFVKHRTGLLHIRAHRVGAARPVFSETIGDGGSHGMPSYVKAPAAGCWHLDLTWNGPHHRYHDSINVRYVARR
ncbi:MAG: hypothetical protein ACRDQA_22180 [Nocardioidaceae bacterium]